MLEVCRGRVLLSRRGGAGEGHASAERLQPPTARRCKETGKEAPSRTRRRPLGVRAGRESSSAWRAFAHLSDAREVFVASARAAGRRAAQAPFVP